VIETESCLEERSNESLKSLADKLGANIIAYRFALASLLIPLAIRGIPEIIAGPFPIGYDSIASYVPLMHAWSLGKISSFPSSLLGGSLIIAIFGTIFAGTGIDPIAIVKVAAPLLYGAQGLSEYVFARRYMLWTNRRALLLALVASIYFVSLRISWDLMRETLAMTSLFFALAISKNLESKVSTLGFSSLLLVTTIAQPLVGGLATALVLIRIVSQNNSRALQLVSTLPSVVLLVGLLAGFEEIGTPVLSQAAQNVQPLNSYVFAAYLFIPILPLVALGARSPGLDVMRNWIIVCLLGLLASTTPISISQLVWPTRWSFLMVFPLMVYATQGLLRLRKSNVQLRIPGRSLGTLWIILLIVLAGTYVGLPSDRAFVYYQFVTPTSMLQSTIPVEYSGQVKDAFQWLSTNALKGSGVMATDPMYGWSTEYFSGTATVVWFQSGTTLSQALQGMRGLGYTKIYTVWWSDGQGWYGDPTVPPGFSRIQNFGHFGVYLYVE